MVQQLPYFKLRLGRLADRKGTHVEKGVDVRIAVDMLIGAFEDYYDTAILVMGDGDLAVIADRVSDMGKHVENACFRKSRSRDLENACHRFIELTEDMVQPWLIDKGAP